MASARLAVKGTWWLVQILRDLENGQGTEADLDKLLDICDNISRSRILRVR